MGFLKVSFGVSSQKEMVRRVIEVLPGVSWYRCNLPYVPFMRRFGKKGTCGVLMTSCFWEFRYYQLCISLCFDLSGLFITQRIYVNSRWFKTGCLCQSFCWNAKWNWIYYVWNTLSNQEKERSLDQSNAADAVPWHHKKQDPFPLGTIQVFGSIFGGQAAKITKSLNFSIFFSCYEVCCFYQTSNALLSK